MEVEWIGSKLCKCRVKDYCARGMRQVHLSVIGLGVEGYDRQSIGAN